MPGSLEEAAAGACAPSLPQKAGTPRGARPSPRAPARSPARARGPEASPPALRVGATPARARAVSGRPEWPGSLGSGPPAAPSRLPANRFFPFLAEWGRRRSGSRALDPARARSRAVSRCLARAALRFPSVSGAEGSVKQRPRFLFPFLPLPSVGSSILHPATPPTRPARPAAVAVATVDRADRLTPASGGVRRLFSVLGSVKFLIWTFHPSQNCLYIRLLFWFRPSMTLVVFSFKLVILETKIQAITPFSAILCGILQCLTS